MSRYSTFLIGVLLAPQVQIVAAESNYDRYSGLINSAMATATKYIDLISSLSDGKITASYAATRIKQLSWDLSVYKLQVTKLAPELSEEECQQINEEMADPEVVEAFRDLDEAVRVGNEYLKQKKFYNNARLKTAYQKFNQAYR